jgi:hypothetical protein
MTELRCYTFTIFQLSPIQQGIQAGHAAVELVDKYRLHNDVLQWASTHKTLVCLNGGTVGDLKGLIEFLSDEVNPYPWTTFTESDEFLAGITTSVAIVLPERVFGCAKLYRESFGPARNQVYSHDPVLDTHRFYVTRAGKPTVEEFGTWEFELMQRLNAAPLAR